MTGTILYLLVAVSILLLTHYLVGTLLKNFLNYKLIPAATLVTDLIIILLVSHYDPSLMVYQLIGLVAWAHYLLYSVFSNSFNSDYYPRSGTTDYWITISLAFLTFVYTNQYYLVLIKQLIGV